MAINLSNIINGVKNIFSLNAKNTQANPYNRSDTNFSKAVLSTLNAQKGSTIDDFNYQKNTNKSVSNIISNDFGGNVDNLIRSIPTNINYQLGNSDSMFYGLNPEGVAARAWQEQMSNTAHQRETADLRAAGLNPVLSANNGATAYSASSGATNTDVAKLQAAISLKTAQMAMNSAMNVANINAAATRYMADRNVLGSTFGSVLNLVGKAL